VSASDAGPTIAAAFIGVGGNIAAALITVRLSPRQAPAAAPPPAEPVNVVQPDGTYRSVRVDGHGGTGEWPLESLHVKDTWRSTTTLHRICLLIAFAVVGRLIAECGPAVTQTRRPRIQSVRREVGI
jgi:hypothetical protein